MDEYSPVCAYYHHCIVVGEQSTNNIVKIVVMHQTYAYKGWASICEGMVNLRRKRSLRWNRDYCLWETNK